MKPSKFNSITLLNVNRRKGGMDVKIHIDNYVAQGYFSLFIANVPKNVNLREKGDRDWIYIQAEKVLKSFIEKNLN